MIHVLGASGFIGREIAKTTNHREDICFYSSKPDFCEQTKFNFFSLTDKESWKNISLREEDRIIFLCWKNLPNYQKAFHITENLPDSLAFFKFLSEKQIKKIVIAGTCYEYGIQNGELYEEMPTKPVNNYAIAKDSLRALSKALFESSGIEYAWLRIFYPYGEGQNSNSLIPTLKRAIEKGDEYFDTSQGDQIRDFIHISDVAKAFIKVIDSKTARGLINVGSSNPVSIRDFLESYIESTGSTIKLRLGAYPRKPDEPLAFWANCNKLIGI